MTNSTTITDAEYEAALAVVAMKDRQRQEEIARQRQALFEAVRPLVESEEFIAVHEQVVALRNDGPKDDSFFGIQLEAVYNGMTGLGIQVANWHPIVTDPAPQPVLPAPPSEGNADGE